MDGMQATTKSRHHKARPRGVFLFEVKIMRKTIIVAALVLISAIAMSGQDAKLREVKGQTIKSKDIPPVELTFGKDFKYVGGHKFVLYNVANAEQHFFVDADKDGRVRRMYWVQFEGYLPTNDKTYDYKGTKSVNIGGIDFIADTYARNIKANPGRPDGDAAMGRAFLESKGYRLASDEVISQRLLYFIGEKRRDELMIIYVEDMSGLGLTSADVAKGGNAEAKFGEIADALLARTQRDLKIKLTSTGKN